MDKDTSISSMESSTSRSRKPDAQQRFFVNINDEISTSSYEEESDVEEVRSPYIDRTRSTSGRIRPIPEASLGNLDYEALYLLILLMFY